jgi:RNA polymerase primary sigma factor
MEESLIGPYLNEASRFAKLSAQEETALAIAVQAAAWERTVPTDLQDAQVIKRGRLARERLATANLLLVVSIARQRTRKSFPILEAIQCGNEGLMHAIDHFDPNYRKDGQPVRLSTYAKFWIKKEISRGAKVDLRSVRLPDNMIEVINGIRRQARALSAGGQEPTSAQIAQAMGLTITEVESALAHDRETLSLDHPFADGEETLTLADTLSDPESQFPSETLERQEMSEGMEDVLFSLTDSERMVVEMRFGFTTGHTNTLEDVAREISLTRERIRQIEAAALAKLSRDSRRRYLRDIQ